MSSNEDSRKQSIYFQEDVLREIREEAARLDRPISWIVQRAWKVGRSSIKKMKDCPSDEEPSQGAGG